MKDCEKGLIDRPLRARLAGGILEKMGSFLGGGPRSVWYSEMYIRCIQICINITELRTDEDWIPTLRLDDRYPMFVLSTELKSHVSADDVGGIPWHWELQSRRLLCFLLFDQRPRDTLARQLTRCLSKQYFSYAVPWQ
jgi:hypothetical protein